MEFLIGILLKNFNLSALLTKTEIMKMLSIVCTKKLEYVVRRCVMPLLIPFLIVNVISCGDDFVEDTGGGSIPPEEIITPPVYMLLDGPYKSGVVLTRNEDDSYINVSSI